MTIRHLKIFMQICECGSFTKTAELLNMTQPAISAAVKELEQYYNVKLFDRLNRKIYLTEQGQNLLFYAKKIVRQFNAADENIRNANTNNLLRVGSNISYAYSHFPALLEHFSGQFPDIKIKSLIANTDFIEKKLLSHELDFGIVDNINISNHFKGTMIHKETMLMVCGRDYYNRLPSKLTPEDLQNHPFLFREQGSGMRDSIDEVFSYHSLTPNIVMESTSISALANAAVHNLGITVIPEQYAQAYIKNGQLYCLHIDDMEFLRHYFLIYHRNKYISTTMNNFITFVNQYIL